MSEQKEPVSGGWDKATELLGKAKEAATAGAKKAAVAAQAGVEKAQQTMDDMEKKAAEAKASKVASGGWDAPVESATYAPQGGTPVSGSGILVDPSEQITATIGSNYLQNFLSGGKVENGIGLLTDKRFYYKGRNFSGSGKAMKSRTEEGMVSIDDIAFSEFIYTRPTGLLIFAILLTLAAIVTVAVIHNSVGVAGMGICLVAALFFFVKYFTSRQTLFLLSFPGGGFAFDVKYYPIADIRDFQRQLHLLKDHRKEGAAV